MTTSSEGPIVPATAPAARVPPLTCGYLARRLESTEDRIASGGSLWLGQAASRFTRPVASWIPEM